jgi:hypothetical protein
MKKYTLFIFLMLILPVVLWSQEPFEEIHLFQSFMRDATIASKAYDEAFIDFNNYSFGNIYSIGLQGGFAINSTLEINGRFGIGGFKPRQVSGEIGLTDLVISGRYLIFKDSDLSITTGGGLTLPFGEEKAGFGNFTIGGFGALRYTVTQQVLVTSSLGLDIVETSVISDESTASLSLSGGVIYSLNNRIGIISEFQLRTNVEYAMLSAGIDYQLATTRLRGALGIGFDDGAPDVRVIVGYLFSF